MFHALIHFIGYLESICSGSSKNLKHKERHLEIPVSYVAEPGLCVVTGLLSPLSPLFLKTYARVIFAWHLTCYLAVKPSLVSLLQVLKAFAKGSGLKINKNKSKIICPADSTLPQSDILKGIPIVQEIKILGIRFKVIPSDDCR